MRSPIAHVGIATPLSRGDSMTIRWCWLPFDALSVHELYALMALRQTVFVVEQGCAYLDADGRDPQAYHLLGWREADMVAALRVFPPDEKRHVWIGRVVTSPAARGTGLGRPLMREGLRRAEETFGLTPVRIGAQAHLERFYASVGFAVCGPGFMEDGIPHVPMIRAL